MITEHISPVKIFVLFDDKDEIEIQRLEAHCASLVHKKKIEVYHHQKIQLGQIVEYEIEKYVKEADVILLMITVNLLNKEIFSKIEEIALERAKIGRSIVIPVYLKHCNFDGYNFTTLRRIPIDGMPVMLYGSDPDERFKEVAIEIHRMVESINSSNQRKKTDVIFSPKTIENKENIKILFIINNPEQANSLQINEEINCIKHRLLFGKCSCGYELVLKNVDTIEGLHKALLETRPYIVHFSGYATQDDKLVFKDVSGKIIPIHAEGLCSLFNSFKDNLKLVFLNSCYSESQAAAIAKTIPYVMGVKGSISNEVAIEFVKGFYQALSYGASIEKSYNLGRNLLQLNFPDQFEKISISKKQIALKVNIE